MSWVEISMMLAGTAWPHGIWDGRSKIGRDGDRVKSDMVRLTIPQQFLPPFDNRQSSPETANKSPLTNER